MKLSRRNVLKTLAAAPMLHLGTASAAAAQQPFRLAADDPALVALAEVLLPAEADRTAALAAFVTWHERYRESADTDHGYGNTRIRTTGPRPDRTYPAQLGTLDAAARAAGATGFAAATLAQRRAIVEAAIADAKVDRLPARPTGAHIATDLMGHYFSSSSANDLCYQAAIDRDACRGLAGSDVAPAPRPPRSGGRA